MIFFKVLWTSGSFLSPCRSASFARTSNRIRLSRNSFLRSRLE